MNREKQNELSRKKILDASLKEFGERDYSLASINKICKDNNISKGLLFHYYKNKDEIFLLCVKNLFLNLSEYLNKEYEFRKMDLENTITEFMSKRFEFFEKFPYYKQIFYTASFNPPKHLQSEISNLRKPIIAINKEFWGKVINQMDLKANIEKEEVIEVIMGLGDNLHIKIQNNMLVSDFKKVNVPDIYSRKYASMINMLLYGILKE